MDHQERLRALACKEPSESVDCDVEAVEDAIGVQLPGSYRRFLASCGGWWGDIVCPCLEPTPFGNEHWINGFHDAGEVRSLLTSMVTPRNMVTIGWGHFAKYTCLSIAGIDRGAVYALDGEFRVYWSDEEFHERFNAMGEDILEYLKLRRDSELPEKPDSYDSIYLLADDFEEFLSRCQPSTNE